MCGIAGYIGKSKISDQAVQQTLELMKNRGPDHSDYQRISQSSHEAVLLHSRLSIIDLDHRSDQPFEIDGCTLIYNGEIYNYKEVRQKLIDQGVTFRTESDTEVLLRSYLMYGADCVDELEGMWAFAVYDRRNQTLLISRDRFAEKPLYYLETETGYYFGSEVKLIQQLYGQSLRINYDHLKRYLVNGYKSLYKTAETFFEGVREVPFGNNLLINSNLQSRFSRYWVPMVAERPMSMEEAIEGFRHHFNESIRLRLRSDVPMAFCLSGGVDSSAIVSTAAKVFNYDVATFSIIDSDERYNERENIEATLADLGCKHTIIDIPRDNFMPRLRDLIDYHDAPLYTASYYIHSFLSEAIARQGYKVVCSGTGADELVTGYYDHFNLYLYEMRRSPRLQQYIEEWQQNTGQFVRNPFLKNPRIYFDQPDLRDHIYLNNEEFAGYLTEEFAEPFMEISYCDSLLRNRMMNEMFHEGTRVILHEDDLNSMKYSIENRSPYLDRRLFEFAYSIPTEHLIHKGLGKYVLREALSGVLNDKVRLETKKVGFNASIHSLLDLDDPANRAMLLDDSDIYRMVDRNKIEKLLDQKPLANSFSKFLFNFINAKVFVDLNTRSSSADAHERVFSAHN